MPLDQFDPLQSFPFRIEKEDKVATAGSCFAQHIARRLNGQGFNYLVTEPGHPIANQELRSKYGYGVFSARYGNIYTARQLVQLFDEAFEQRQPELDVWQYKDAFVDPLRPAVEPNGYATAQEVKLNRKQHLRAVREMFETTDIFVFTLGLTEAWVNKADDTVFPLCPGVHGGTFSDELYAFKNFKVSEVVDDLENFLAKLKNVNPQIRVIFTVSPVPLAATAHDRNVVVSTTYSKAVLRAAAEEVIENNRDFCAYFPSYEIICALPNRGTYFAEDMRSVTETGVDHVMSVFFRHVTNVELGEKPVVKKKPEEDIFLGNMLEAQKVVCEEEMLAGSKSS
jgi:hypothetical protein